MKRRPQAAARPAGPLPPDERGLELVAERFRALGDPTRLKIIRVLCKGERCVQDLVAEVGAGQTNISKHLGLLSRAGLVAHRRDGRFLFYRIGAREVEGVCALVCNGIKTRLEEQAGVLDLLHPGEPAGAKGTG